MKKIKSAFSIVMVILCGFVLWKWYAFSEQENKFALQKLDSSRIDLENIWGKPNKIINSDGIVLFYNSQNCLGHHYVFRFDENQKLIGKYYDD
ncbi:hypothetical protein [Flavobacterium terrisoli]|uniref:hypothetical protein n=1 Tax=Flavobacterium terrisoli TaxID=3242195 RepID=UPI002543B13E|nr:hypothetical protein [Flavobacterium buctense]